LRPLLILAASRNESGSTDALLHSCCSWRDCGSALTLPSYNSTTVPRRPKATKEHNCESSVSVGALLPWLEVPGIGFGSDRLEQCTIWWLGCNRHAGLVCMFGSIYVAVNTVCCGCQLLFSRRSGLNSTCTVGRRWRVHIIFTARCYASAVLAMALCLSVCLSQVGVLLKRLNLGSHKQHHTIAQGL